MKEREGEPVPRTMSPADEGTASDPSPSPPTRGGAPDPVDLTAPADPAAPTGVTGWKGVLPASTDAALPYLGAAAVGLAAMITLVAATALPAAGVFQVGLTFLAVAMVARRVEEIPADSEHPLVAWTADHLDRLGDRFGVEFYGMASLTAFLRAEVISLSSTSLSLADLLSNPVGTAISWLVSEFVESVMNAVWAALWWIPLLQATPGTGAFVATVAVGWLVWRMLDDPEHGREPR